MLPRHDVKYCRVLGTDRIMWGTDSPHPEGSAPHSTEALRTTLFDVLVGECRAMLGGNAAALYGFGLDALAPIAAAIGPRADEVTVPLTEAGHLPGHGVRPPGSARSAALVAAGPMVERHWHPLKAASPT
jgi:hypothetical protein